MKKQTNIKILAIESSCDETAAAVISVDKKGNPVVLSNIVSSQIDLHAQTGGVVPEVASRAHMEAIMPVVAEALNMGISETNSKSLSLDYQQANISLADITHIAVTAGPGLIGSLLVGFNAAKTLAYALNLPIVPINHIEGHIYSAFAQETLSSEHPQPKSPCFEIKNSSFRFPVLALTVSGGHTSLTLMHDHGKYEQIGQTIDDAAGEAYDKVAKLLDLGYPGGPFVARLAQQYRDKVQNQDLKQSKSHTGDEIIFPRPIINDGTFNFSFSGLKTSVLQRVLDLKKQNSLSQIDNTADSSDLTLLQKEALAAAFEQSVADVFCTKVKRAILKYQPKIVLMAGGVSANGFLIQSLSQMVKETDPNIDFLSPPMQLTGDNATMIGFAAFYHLAQNNVSDWNSITVDSNAKLVSAC